MTRNEEYRRDRLAEGYSVYYLPEEHYIGKTNYIKRRMKQHQNKGKCIDGMEIIASFERSVDASWLETMFHMRGYHGHMY